MCDPGCAVVRTWPACVGMAPFFFNAFNSPQSEKSCHVQDEDAVMGGFWFPKFGNQRHKKARVRLSLQCPGWDSNPHALTDTWPSTMPVYQFQHLGGARLVPLVVTRLGLEPRTLSLKVRCSNQLSYQVFSSVEGAKIVSFSTAQTFAT